MRANWSKATQACKLFKVSHARMQKAVMRQKRDLKCRSWDPRRSFWRAPDAGPGGIPGFPQNCCDQLPEPQLILGVGCLWKHWALAESARRRPTHLVRLQICKQLQALDGWHAKHGYYGLHSLEREDAALKVTKMIWQPRACWRQNRWRWSTFFKGE